MANKVRTSKSVATKTSKQLKSSRFNWQNGLLLFEGL